MEHYELQQDEVILYHTNIMFSSSTPKKKDNSTPKFPTEFLLTNFNFVFITRTKRLLAKEKVSVETYSIENVKFYQGRPHIIKKGKKAEIYFLDTEKFIEFENKKEATLFTDTALRLISGQSKFVRAVKKVQKEIQETGDQLDIDINGIAQTAFDVTAAVAITASGLEGASKKTKLLGAIAQTLKDKKQKNVTPLLEAPKDQGDNTQE